MFHKILFLKVLNLARRQRQKSSPNLWLLLLEKDILVQETDISVASIHVQERIEKAISMLRKRKRELEDLQAGVKYYKIHHTKKAKTDDEGEAIHHAKELESKKGEKNDF